MKQEIIPVIVLFYISARIATITCQRFTGSACRREIISLSWSRTAG
jgi:hypothetical protein